MILGFVVLVRRAALFWIGVSLGRRLKRAWASLRAAAAAAAALLTALAPYFRNAEATRHVECYALVREENLRCGKMRKYKTGSSDSQRVLYRISFDAGRSSDTTSVDEKASSKATNFQAPAPSPLGPNDAGDSASLFPDSGAGRRLPDEGWRRFRDSIRDRRSLDDCRRRLAASVSSSKDRASAPSSKAELKRRHDREIRPTANLRNFELKRESVVSGSDGAFEMSADAAVDAAKDLSFEAFAERMLPKMTTSLSTISETSDDSSSVRDRHPVCSVDLARWKDERTKERSDGSMEDDSESFSRNSCRTTPPSSSSESASPSPSWEADPGSSSFGNRIIRSARNFARRRKKNAAPHSRQHRILAAEFRTAVASAAAEEAEAAAGDAAAADTRAAVERDGKSGKSEKLNRLIKSLRLPKLSEGAFKDSTEDAFKDSTEDAFKDSTEDAFKDANEDSKGEESEGLEDAINVLPTFI